MPVINPSGAELYYEEYGSGPETVLSAQNRVTNGPESYLELLAGAGLHVYSIQLRGFGRSSPAGSEPSGGWYPLWAEDIYQFAREVGAARFIYTGVSHGAGVGWNLVLLHPEAIRAFVGVVGGPHDRVRPRLRGMGMASAPGSAPGPMFVVPTDDPVRLRRRAIWNEASREAAAEPINPGKVFPELETNEQLVERLRQVSVPTLLLNGAQDDIIPAETSLMVAQAVPHSKMVLFQDHSHTLARESPERLVAEVEVFLKELAAR